MRKFVFAILILASIAALAAIAETKAIKATHLNDYQVIVSCANGRTPSVANVSGSLVVSCEGHQE